MDPTIIRGWVGVARDAAATVIASFMLVYETVFAATPSALLVGAGLTLLGIPVAFRLEELFRPSVPPAPHDGAARTGGGDREG